MSYGNCITLLPLVLAAFGHQGPLYFPPTGGGGCWYQADLRQWRRRRDRNGKRRRRGSRP